MSISTHRLLSKYPDVMLLADRGFANRELMSWLKMSQWHYCLRLPCDVFIHGARRHPIELNYLCPPESEAVLYHNVGLWLDEKWRSNFVICIRWLKGVMCKGRYLFTPVPLFSQDIQPCFASKRAK